MTGYRSTTHLPRTASAVWPAGAGGTRPVERASIGGRRAMRLARATYHRLSSVTAT